MAVMLRAIHAGALLAVVAAGCGRVGFDEIERTADAPSVPCVPVGHDEDGDTLDDACDLCPYIADFDQPDADGDRVGDGCDPHPTEARDRFVMFDPFIAARPEWSFNRPPTFVGDQLVADARPTQFRADLEMPPTTDSYTVGVHLSAGRATGLRQVALFTLDADEMNQHFCDLNGNETVSASWQHSIFRAALGYSSPAFVDAVGPLENRDVVFTMTREPTEVICRTDWPADQASLTIARPMSLVPARFAIGLIGLSAELSYFAWVHSD